MAEQNTNFQAWRDAVSQTNDCLSLEVLEKLSDGAADSNASRHLAACPHCQSELAMLKSFESSVPSQSEGAAVAWIAAQLERNQSAAAAAPSQLRVPFWRSFFKVPYLAGALAAALVLGLGISFYVSDREPHPIKGDIGIGTFRSGSVKLAGPSGNLSQPPQAFRWEAYPGAKSYRVEVLEVDGTVLWSRQTSETSVPVTPELKSEMHPGKALQWRVTALNASGKEVASSGQEKFQVILRSE
jgi:hypothetical protein